jgi:hypothetical protein
LLLEDQVAAVVAVSLLHRVGVGLQEIQALGMMVIQVRLVKAEMVVYPLLFLVLFLVVLEAAVAIYVKMVKMVRLEQQTVDRVGKLARVDQADWLGMRLIKTVTL